MELETFKPYDIILPKDRDVDSDEDDAYDDNESYDDDSPSYSKYGGYNGYDDDTIDSAFEGMPELTWNID